MPIFRKDGKYKGACDEPGCPKVLGVGYDTEFEAENDALKRGWGIGRDLFYCPEHRGPSR